MEERALRSGRRGAAAAWGIAKQVPWTRVKGPFQVERNRALEQTGGCLEGDWVNEKVGVKARWVQVSVL